MTPATPDPVAEHQPAGQLQRSAVQRPPHDLLVLQRSGRLTLHVGQRPVCEVLVAPSAVAEGSSLYAGILGVKREGMLPLM